MIRYVYIGDQINEDYPNAFAFYDTCRDEFIDFGGIQVFDSIEDFTFYACTSGDIFDRCMNLIPVESTSGHRSLGC